MWPWRSDNAIGVAGRWWAFGADYVNVQKGLLSEVVFQRKWTDFRNGH